jgi:aspartate/methionine/tyrosine aminotransferase
MSGGFICSPTKCIASWSSIGTIRCLRGVNFMRAPCPWAGFPRASVCPACSSAPSEILAMMALAARPRIIADQQARLRRNRAVLEEFLRTWGDRLQLNLPAGGSVCFPRLLGVADTPRFCEEVIRETGILLVASHLFDYGRRHVRLGLGRENFPQVLTRFGDFFVRRPVE